MEFEWKNFPGFTTLGILIEIQKMMAKLKCEPEQFQGRIIFMSISMTLQLYNEFFECWNVATYAKRVPLGCWSFLGPGCETKWYGPHVRKPNGEWNRVAEIITVNFAETGHPIRQATSPLGR